MTAEGGPLEPGDAVEGGPPKPGMVAEGGLLEPGVVAERDAFKPGDAAEGGLAKRYPRQAICLARVWHEGDRAREHDPREVRRLSSSCCLIDASEDLFVEARDLFPRPIRLRARDLTGLQRQVEAAPHSAVELDEFTLGNSELARARRVGEKVEAGGACHCCRAHS